MEMVRFLIITLALVVIVVLTACVVRDQAPVPTLPTLENSFRVAVPARPNGWLLGNDVFTPVEGVQITQGDIVLFSATGTWSVGLGNIGPEGVETPCECVVSELVNGGHRGLLAALVGRIGSDGHPFLIGVQRTVTAKESGTLYLTANDNLGPCDGTNRSSCFSDNRGSVSVEIRIGSNTLAPPTDLEATISAAVEATTEAMSDR